MFSLVHALTIVSAKLYLFLIRKVFLLKNIFEIE